MKKNQKIGDDPSKTFRLWRRDIPWYKNFAFSDMKINGAWIFLFLLVMSAAYYNDIQAYQEVYENPCDYCAVCGYEGGGDVWNTSGIVLPEISSETRPTSSLTDPE